MLDSNYLLTLKISRQTWRWRQNILKKLKNNTEITWKFLTQDLVGIFDQYYSSKLQPEMNTGASLFTSLVLVG